MFIHGFHRARLESLHVHALVTEIVLQLDRFEEDLNISRVQLYAPKPTQPAVQLGPTTPISPQEKEAARKRALEMLARCRAEYGL